MERVLNGKIVKEDILSELNQEVNKLKITPVLAIVQIGNVNESNIYIRNKLNACSRANIESIHFKFDEDITEESLLIKLNNLNNDNGVHGIIVQKPLPKHISDEKIDRAISPIKDVDGFSVYNKGMLFNKTSDRLEPCTPKGAIELLKRYNIELLGKHCLIINRSNLIGKPLSLMLLEEDATVTVAHSKTPDNVIRSMCKRADIVFLGIGCPRSFKPTDFKMGAVVVDFSMNVFEGKICGDMYIDEKYKTNWLKAYTPVPGGCGQTTVAALMKNVVEACKKQVILEVK